MPFFKRRTVAAVDVSLPVELVEPVEPAGPHPLHGEGYEPRFPRTSVTRRVLGHITPEVDRDDLGPRNTLPALTAGLITDDHTEISYPEQVPPYLDALVQAGLVSEKDGVYTVTETGWRELMN